MKQVKVNVSSIAQTCGITTGTATFVLKKIIQTIMLNSRDSIKLNLRIGDLVIESGEVSFYPSGVHPR